jgi:hypothetical protein
MKIISKIAMIWAFPIFIIIITFLWIKSFIVVVSKIIFVGSGTADALVYLFARLRLFLIDYSWKSIQNDDNKLNIPG